MAEKELPNLENILFSIKPCKGVPAVSVALQEKFEIKDAIEILLKSIEDFYREEYSISNVKIDRKPIKYGAKYHYKFKKPSDQWAVNITDVEEYNKLNENSEYNGKNVYWINFDIADNLTRSNSARNSFLRHYKNN